ncbi:hypothetical protein FHR93_001130 [Geodermatophilus sabuli]|uniref:Uncharacterized protein n=1 Tax=Geodermatophilus sabuli TaxID=1564158 RepID=A0A285EIU0_9ACTN|nr:hypothetical protein [Geodermatophilus sabuli]SNX97946.1 hypothetical protein SAMN06893097_10926 [Geodermatophilus sabuli]
MTDLNRWLAEGLSHRPPEWREPMARDIASAPRGLIPADLTAVLEQVGPKTDGPLPALIDVHCTGVGTHKHLHIADLWTLDHAAEADAPGGPWVIASGGRWVTAPDPAAGKGSGTSRTSWRFQCPRCPGPVPGQCRTVDFRAEKLDALLTWLHTRGVAHLDISVLIPTPF